MTDMDPRTGKDWKTLALELGQNIPPQTYDREYDLKSAYEAGFIEACRWSEPVTQDADSPEFSLLMERFIKNHLGPKTKEIRHKIALIPTTKEWMCSRCGTVSVKRSHFSSQYDFAVFKNPCRPLV